MPGARCPIVIAAKKKKSYVYPFSKKAVAFTALYFRNIKINEHGCAAEHVNKLTEFKILFIQLTLRVHGQPSSHDLAAIYCLCKE